MTVDTRLARIETRDKNECVKPRASLYTTAPRYLLRSTEGGGGGGGGGGCVEPPPMNYLPKVNM